MSKTKRPLLHNMRFYILTGSVAISVLVAAILRLKIPSDQLFVIRLEQLFGLISLIFWYVAIITTPLSKLWPKAKLVHHLKFARRAIGVSAAYFALLHASIATWGQLDGISGALSLPIKFQRALLFGVIALVVLTLMAITSFDKAIQLMTFKWWKWLHRFVYAAGILVILHVWIIGTHLGYPTFRWIGFVALSLLFMLESIRVTKLLGKKWPEFIAPDAVIPVAICLWIVSSVLLLSLPNTVSSYHTHHTQSQDGSAQGGEHDH